MAALGAAAGVWAALRWGDDFLERFEDTSSDDLATGEYITTSGGWRLHFTVEGEGTPVVLIHGLMDSVHTWRRNVSALAATHRVYAIDVLGFGSSARVRAPIYGLKQQAAVLNEFFDAVGLTRATVIGHSLGGAQALQFAYDFPEKVHKLVLIAPATFLYARLAGRRLRPLPRRLTRGVLGLYYKLQGDSPNLLRYAYADASQITPEALGVRKRMMHVRGTHDTLISMSQSVREADVPRGLSDLHVRTLIIWGRHDRVVPVTHASRHQRALPNARLEWIETAGHLPHEEAPDAVNDLIRSFLA